MNDLGPPRLLFIDDKEGQLTHLPAKVEPLLAGTNISIDVWRPAAGDALRTTLVEKLEPRPTLVVTDHDLTEAGAAGLLGGGVISWCRAHAIPVGDYSNKFASELEEPDLFEFRFSADAPTAAGEIADLAKGFVTLPSLLAAVTDEGGSGWSYTLAAALDRAGLASAFSLYSARTGASHRAEIERLTDQYGEPQARKLLETYVVGHLLNNGILRYPGPILDALALCSYLAISDDNVDVAAELFAAARYNGPFGGLNRFFWQTDVDERLIALAEAAGVDDDLDDAMVRRKVVSHHLEPGLHPCTHCDGSRGGFRCPYTGRTTCDLPECSVPTTSWIPQGAYLTRVDRDYFERWAPLLGM
jgi:hypothetical protein